ncbi:hypothetical protein DJ71_10970, partial [Halorubrum sp. E3]
NWARAAASAATTAAELLDELFDERGLPVEALGLLFDGVTQLGHLRREVLTLDAGALERWAVETGDTPETAETTEADAFDGSPFESAGVEDADLATEVAALRRTVEQQSERLDRQSALIEQLIEELRRGR